MHKHRSQLAKLTRHLRKRVLYSAQTEDPLRLESIRVSLCRIRLCCASILAPLVSRVKVCLTARRAVEVSSPMTPISSTKYTMTISRLTVDKLGVRLYDKVSAVLAELVANSYDADATEVVIRAPMGELLASKRGDSLIDKGYVIEIEDNGVGMTPDEVNAFYLRVGAERRLDPKRGDTSRRFKRKVMGRKGVGKLAPFGICQRIEIITSGGDLVHRMDEHGHDIQGYLTAHLILDRVQILSDNDGNYSPDIGSLDETLSPRTGTLLRLTNFTHRHVPAIDDLSRQLAQRFGLKSANWKIELVDATKDPADSNHRQEVGSFDIPQMENTAIRFTAVHDDHGRIRDYQALSSEGHVRLDVSAGFDHEGRFYPVTGWVAYARDNYKDDLMAGVRIYCRGKIAAQTNIFNLKSGFTGEYDIRSYLVGELHADWLDEAEDLIQTDRRDILWSHELGQAFERWGQSLVKKVGQAARDPVKKKTWETFKETTNIEQRINQAFPASSQGPIRERALKFAKLVGQTMREDEVRDTERTEAIVQLSLTFAPHVTLDEKLREAGDAEGSALSVITSILRTARIAELASFGQIADDRIRVIARVATLKDDPDTLESVFQKLIEEAPWLIDPQWSPITSNQSFSTLKAEFAKYYKAKTGEDIFLGDFAYSTRRADFVLSTQDNFLQIIEIKRPFHQFENIEMERLNTYIDQMDNFLREPQHEPLTRVFRGFHVTLVCDGERLTGVHKSAFELLRANNRLNYISWVSFLAKTRKMHEEFLAEAERQKRDAARAL
jgi:Asp-tRNA(Asn)/Glu-tRNA(Gln) amidotransferase C subunit